MLDRFVSWLYVTRVWGKRCSDYQEGCPTCEHWKEHDWLFNDDE